MSSYGIFIFDDRTLPNDNDEDTPTTRRPKSKKEVKELIALKLADDVWLQDTSAFHSGNYSGRLDYAPDGRYEFVGPDPYTNRKFYGTITITNGRITVK
jgi:hypothetical protein